MLSKVGCYNVMYFSLAQITTTCNFLFKLDIHPRIPYPVKRSCLEPFYSKRGFCNCIDRSIVPWHITPPYSEFPVKPSIVVLSAVSKSVSLIPVGKVQYTMLVFIPYLQTVKRQQWGKLIGKGCITAFPFNTGSELKIGESLVKLRFCITYLCHGERIIHAKEITVFSCLMFP